MHDQAINDFSALLQNEATHIESLLARGNAYIKKGLPDYAISDFSRVLKHDPENVSASFARAACYNSLGEFSNAIEDYKLALSKDQSKCGAYRGSNRSWETLPRPRYHFDRTFIL